jgi:carbonic anhydrase/acetyltransferase-like protein (isoleucine patch superfamily)
MNRPHVIALDEARPDIGDDTLIGMGAVVLNGAVVGDGCLIAAGAVVADAVIPPRSLVAGVPGKVRRELSDADVAANVANAADYVRLLAIHAVVAS